MPRKTRRPSEFRVPVGTARPPLWPRYLLVALLAAIVGAGGTYLALRSSLQRVTSVQSNVSVQAGAVTSDLKPPAGVTEGLSPDKAALNLGNWYEDHNQWKPAIKAYTQAIDAGLDNPDVRTDLGVAYYRSGQPQQALVQYQAAQTQNPRHENSLFNQGSVYVATGDTNQAISVWRLYLQRFPQGQHVADARQLIAQVGAGGSRPSFTPPSSTPAAPSASF